VAVAHDMGCIYEGISINSVFRGQVHLLMLKVPLSLF
jgi:hypothetical protein